MQRSTSTLARLAAVAAVGALFSLGAAAQSNWNIVANGNSGGQCGQNAANTGNYNNSYACNNGSATVTVSAWSTNRGVGTAREQTVGANQWSNAHINTQGTSGFGAASRTEGIGVAAPDHAFDSINGGAEFMLLDFGSAQVVLDKLGMGWVSDGDVTVMRWRGDGAGIYSTGATTVGGNKTLSSNLWSAGNPTVAGWEHVRSFDNFVGDGSSPYGDNARTTGATNSQASSWWLVSTFNSTLTGGSFACYKADNTVGTCDQGDDGFKLNYISASAYTPPGNVSAPGTLALAGVALLGVFGVRRRSTAA